jgi:hypothetical protein
MALVYANLVWLANTVKAAEPVLTIVYTEASMLEALPAANAVPPWYFGVTAEPSIWKPEA